MFGFLFNSLYTQPILIFVIININECNKNMQSNNIVTLLYC